MHLWLWCFRNKPQVHYFHMSFTFFDQRFALVGHICSSWCEVFGQKRRLLRLVFTSYWPRGNFWFKKLKPTRKCYKPQVIKCSLRTGWRETGNHMQTKQNKTQKRKTKTYFSGIITHVYSLVQITPGRGGVFFCLNN